MRNLWMATPCRQKAFKKSLLFLLFFLKKNLKFRTNKPKPLAYLGGTIIHAVSALFFLTLIPHSGHTKGEADKDIDKVSGIRAGIFQKDVTWVTIDNLENGTLVFFNKLMAPLLCLKNVGKIVDFRVEKSLLSSPLLEIEFERSYSENGIIYSAVVGELFEIYNDKLTRIYSYTKQLFYTVKKESEYKQIIFKGMLKADEVHKNTVKLIIQTNQAISELKARYLVDQFTIDDTTQERSFKYHVTFPDGAQLDKPPLNIDLLGGGTTYKLINNVNKKK